MTARAGRGRPGPAARRLAHHPYRRLPGAYRVGEVSSYPAAAPAAWVLVDHRPRLVPVVEEDSAWVRADTVRGRRMREERVHSLMVVPLLVRGRALGLVALYRWTDRGAFQRDDLTLAEDLAARAAVALDNAHRYARERNAVLSLQRGLLPQRLPAADAVQAAHHWVHSGAGGDWTDVITLPGAGWRSWRAARPAGVCGPLPRWGGCGPPCTLASLELAPDEVMARLEDLVRQMDAEAAGAPAAGPVGATCLYLVYDPVTCRCSVATAGPAGLALVAADRTVTFPDVPAGPPLGRPGPPFAKATLSLPEGEPAGPVHPGAVAGLLRGRRAPGADPRAGRGLARPRRICAYRLTERLVPPDPPEDAAVLVARTRPLDPARVATWTPAGRSGGRRHRPLPGLPAAERLGHGGRGVRHRTDRQRAGHQRHPLRRAPVQLRLIRDRTLSVEVSDGSSTAPYLRHARTTDEGGRGLLLVSQFAQRGERVTRTAARRSGSRSRSRRRSDLGGVRQLPQGTGA
ncbi:SpoIIE family protein phosphatase [Streptomyces tricolor]|nr:SpoIIE family protein phosphatase [Streptomyces tricolor]